MTTDTLWYFAIGSMINPISCSARNIVPKESRPAELLDHSLYFFGSIGVAEALPEPGVSFHGVAHLVDTETMERLDVFERDYIRITATAKLYDGTIRQVQVYSRSKDIERSPAIDKPPSERYLEIITRGCEHHGVSQVYIDSIKRLDFIPRPTPSKFLAHGTMSDELPTFTRTEIMEIRNKQDRIIMTINSKVFEFLMDDKAGAWNHILDLKTTLGFEGEVMLSKVAYDPKYGILNSLNECTREHSAYLEDAFVRYMISSKLIDCWKLIGRYANQSYSNEEKLLWYFAIGSMTNPTSCKGRNFFPIQSKPAILLDHRLHFFGQNGVAEALPAPGQSFHGVAHLIDPNSMLRLDVFEIGYTRKTATALAYDGTKLDVQCYSRPDDTERNHEIDKCPTERYLEVIATGCEHHGVHKEYVAFLRNHKKQARPKPDEFICLGELVQGMGSMTRSDIALCMKNGDRVLITVNGKVFELSGDKDSRIWNVMGNGPFQALGSFESEVVLSQTFFDPLYGICSTLEDVSREHSAYIEDMHSRFSFVQGRPSPWKIIATYADQKYRD